MPSLVDAADSSYFELLLSRDFLDNLSVRADCETGWTGG